MDQNFRSAFNGFNREDVVHYLEYFNNRHAAQVNQLTADTEFLRQQLEAAQQDNHSEHISALESRCQELEDQLAESRQSASDLEQRCAQLERELAQIKSAPVVPAAPAFHAEQELEAYRRAERTERMAKERADLVYRQTNSVLSDAAAKVDEATLQINGIADLISAQIQQLQNAVTSSRQALKDAAATMSSLRPNDQV